MRRAVAYTSYVDTTTKSMLLHSKEIASSLGRWTRPCGYGLPRRGMQAFFRTQLPLTPCSQCTALLQGHTSLVGQLQLSGDRLVTGGSDGRVIVFDLTSQTCLHRLCAHDNSVTCLQFDHRFIVSGGNDGRVKLWNMQTGNFIRELTKPCDAVWRVAFRDDKCAILLQREGKTVLEVITFRPEETKGKMLSPRAHGSGAIERRAKEHV